MGWKNKNFFKWSWSHDQDGACIVKVKTFKNHLLQKKTEWLRPLKLGIKFVHMMTPDLVHMLFCIGKHLNSGFLRNYCSL